MTMELDGEIFTIHPQHDIHLSASTPKRIINRLRYGLVFTVISIPPRHEDRVLV
jgi:mannose-6-phosphate isomerase-like protein (cupin superfamily)